MMHMRWVGWFWLSILAGILIFAVLGPMAVPADAARLTEPARQFIRPGAQNLLGTDQAGRDVLARSIYAARTSLLSALAAAGIAMLLGIGVGGVAGAAGQIPDWLLMRWTDVLLAFPGLLIALTLTALLNAGVWQAALAVGFALSPITARLVRAAVLEIATRQYVEVSRSFGAGPIWIACIHMLPGIAGQLIAFATIVLSYALLNLAALDYLGVTGDPTLPTWGHMLADGRSYLSLAPWIALVPGLMLTLTVLSAVGLGDSISRFASHRERK